MAFRQGDIVMYKGVQATVASPSSRGCLNIHINKELLQGPFRKLRWQDNVNHLRSRRQDNFQFRVKPTSLTPFGTTNREFAKHLLNEEY